MKNMRFIICIILLLFAPHLFAQISEGGTPISFSKFQLSKHVPAVVMPPVDVETLLKEDSVNDQYKDIPWRFGYNIPVNLNLENSGLWEDIGKGNRIWRLKIRAPGALSINLTFDEYYLPEGAKLFIYNESKSEIIGAFTAQNNNQFRKLGTTIVHGDASIVEYFVPAYAKASAGKPAKAANQGSLSIGTVTHGYRDLFSFAKDLGDSGPCNNNVICPEGIPWQDQIRSVAIIIVGGNSGCTGALINNTCNDGTPYFLTANHCLDGSVPTWVFRFNWDSPTCTPTQNGPVNQTVSGATLRASNAGSDFGLLELSAQPPLNYNVFYAGWDNSGINPNSQVAIHHPSGDVKKISFDNNPATTATWSGASVWEIGNWEDGTTEPGSSGSPLFDQNGRIIGQLYGGTASCASLTDDNYGRFDVSWDAGGSPTNQLVNWLDGCNSGATTNDGYDPNTPPDTIDAGISGIIFPVAETLCSVDSVAPVVRLKNYGIDTLTSVIIYYGIDNDTNTYNWTGSLAYMATEDINLTTLFFTPGTHTFHASTSNPNGNTDEDTINDAKQVSFNSVYGSVVTLKLTTDDYGSETTWDVKDSLGAVLFSGGPYGSSQTYTEEFCLDPGCYDFTIYDSYGDGICCGFGNGSYLVENESGDTLASGGLFTFSETTNFCIIPVLPPVAGFTVNDSIICEGESVSFYDQSADLPTSWNWSFPGGAPSSDTLRNPIVTYDTVGVYEVTLIATNALGSDTLTINAYITVNPALTVTTTGTDASCNRFCDGSATLTTSGGTSPYTYSWNTNPVQTTLTVTGLCAGAYSVIVTDTNVCTASDTIIIVEPPPSVIVSASSDVDTTYLSAGGNVAFISNSTGATSWLWDFGDGDTSTAQNPAHIYDSVGIYTVILTVFDDSSCQATDTLMITVLQGSGLEENTLANTLKIYPNPSFGIINLEFLSDKPENIRLTMFNIIGETIFTKNLKDIFSGIYTIDISGKANGIYYIHILTEDEVIVKKISVVK